MSHHVHFCMHFKILGRKICAWPFCTEGAVGAGQLSQDADPPVRVCELQRGSLSRTEERKENPMGADARLPSNGTARGRAGRRGRRSSGHSLAPARHAERCPPCKPSARWPLCRRGRGGRASTAVGPGAPRPGPARPGCRGRVRRSPSPGWRGRAAAPR